MSLTLRLQVENIDPLDFTMRDILAMPHEERIEWQALTGWRIEQMADGRIIVCGTRGPRSGA